MRFMRAALNGVSLTELPSRGCSENSMAARWMRTLPRHLNQWTLTTLYPTNAPNALVSTTNHSALPFVLSTAALTIRITAKAKKRCSAKKKKCTFNQLQIGKPREQRGFFIKCQANRLITLQCYITDAQTTAPNPAPTSATALCSRTRHIGLATGPASFTAIERLHAEWKIR